MSQPSPNSQSMPPMVKATLTPLPDGDSITVHFNPTSLVYTVENSTPQQGGDPKRRQYAASFTGKLTMDLQFDTTDSGSDVREVTSQVAQFMQSSADANQNGSSGSGGTNQPAPPVLSFEWGAYEFQGFMESFKETIDFFSADGIPLRSLVSIGLARQDDVFDAGPGASTDTSGSLVPTSQSMSVTKLATQGGDASASRALASANGLESTRFTGGASLQVSGGIQLNAAVGFVSSASTGAGASGGLGLSLTASAGAGISAGAGAGISVGGGIGISAGGSASAGVSLGVSAGVSASAGASVSAGVSVSGGAGAQVTLAAGGGALFGSQASAGVPATMGAFAGLQTGVAKMSTTAQLNPLRMLPATVGTDVSVGANATFSLGGIATAPSGFSTSVNAGGSLTDSLVFDSD